MIIKLSIITIVLVLGVIAVYGVSVMELFCNSCNEWQSKVDPEVKYVVKHTSTKLSENSSKVVKVETTAVFDDEKRFFRAVECLLKLEGKKGAAKVWGATKPETSQLFDSARVDVAALYYVSFLFYERWDHAAAIALVDNSGTMNDDAIVKKAFASYREWFIRVRQIGLDEARRQKLDPLANSGIGWY
jgi:hypothetical protein